MTASSMEYAFGHSVPTPISPKRSLINSPGSVVKNLFAEPPDKQRRVAPSANEIASSTIDSAVRVNSAYERPSQRLRMALEQVLDGGDLSELRRLLRSPYRRPSERLRAALERVLDFGQPLAWDLLFEELRSARWEAAALAKSIELVQSLLGGGAADGSKPSAFRTSLSDSEDEGCHVGTRSSRNSCPPPQSNASGRPRYTFLERSPIDTDRRRRSYLENSDVSDEETNPKVRKEKRAVDEQREQHRMMQEQAWAVPRQQLADAVLETSKLVADGIPTQDALEKIKTELNAALEQARSKNLPHEEIVEATRCRQRLSKSWVERIISENVMTKNVTWLQDLKKQLSDAIWDAKSCGVSEIELGGGENHRRRLHNMIEDLKGSIRVFCRVRPLSDKELDQGDSRAIKAMDSMTLEVDTGKSTSIKHPSETDVRRFAFDSVFNPASQQEVFQDCRELLQSAFDGYNATIFAYGQTGSGKTHTMAGNAEQPGLAPQIISEIYRIGSRDEGRFSHYITASMLELYRNDLIDLLQAPVIGDSSSSSASASAGPRKVNIRTDREGNVHVENATEEHCVDVDALSSVLERGTTIRKTAATAMNSHSSRSHLILIIKIVRTNRETGEELRGKVMLVDLAGSERIKKSQVSGDTQKEAIEINKSLTALGDVIEALTQEKASVPYRNHKLTQILQDSLGRTAKTLMFVHCSPTRSNVEETLASLKYAQRAKKIILGQVAGPRNSLAEPGAAALAWAAQPTVAS